MRQTFSLFCFALSCFWFITPIFAQNQNDHVPGEILVQLRATVRASAWASQEASLRAAG